MDFFVNDNSHQFYKNCSGFSHSKGTVMQCTFLESKNIGIFRDINFLMPDYELLQIKRVKLLKFFVAKTLIRYLTLVLISFGNPPDIIRFYYSIFHDIILKTSYYDHYKFFNWLIKVKSFHFLN